MGTSSTLETVYRTRWGRMISGKDGRGRVPGESSGIEQKFGQWLKQEHPCDPPDQRDSQTQPDAPGRLHPAHQQSPGGGGGNGGPEHVDEGCGQDILGPETREEVAAVVRE